MLLIAKYNENRIYQIVTYNNITVFIPKSMSGKLKLYSMPTALKSRASYIINGSVIPVFSIIASTYPPNPLPQHVHPLQANRRKQ